jgi:hypothetical protein
LKSPIDVLQSTKRIHQLEARLTQRPSPGSERLDVPDDESNSVARNPALISHLEFKRAR